jgi:hypothetical protein
MAAMNVLPLPNPKNAELDSLKQMDIYYAQGYKVVKPGILI